MCRWRGPLRADASQTLSRLTTTEVSLLAELTFKVVYQCEDDQSLEWHTPVKAEDLMRRALAGHAAMYDLEVTGQRAPIDSFPPA